MKLATFRFEGRVCVGRFESEGQRIRTLYAEGVPVSQMVSLIADPALLAKCTVSDRVLTQSEVELLAPIPRPARNIFCVGKNYSNHANEFSGSGFDAGHSESADAIPKYPIIFTKPPQTVVGHGAKVWAAATVSDSLDYEAELAVIIGKGGRGIRKVKAMSHVWGYTIVNDVTARDWQKRHKQWFLGKSFDTFCPMGPLAVSADEVNAGNLDVKCWINGELRQNANTKDLIFDVPTLIETISAGITLYPGDIIATGTPEGVGIGFKPPKFLKAGDRMAIEIQGLGRLENEIEA
jgi:2-keto-4-pentenoate hydratase/2-oxohepta-3-ene-1,7-dioic acid hydratase in catechol pathway